MHIKKHLKIILLMFAFSIVMTYMFAETMLFFAKRKPEIVQDAVYLLSSAEYEDVFLNNGTIKMKADNLIGNERYQTEFTKQLKTNLVPVSYVIFAFLFVFSLCFYYVLRWLQIKKSKKIVYELKASITDDILTEDPVLALAYAELKQMFEHQLSDFKRLSSYMTHEQKNEISILRARMELLDQTDDIVILDNLTNGIDDILTISENIASASLVIVDIAVVCAEVFDIYRKTIDSLYFEFNGNEDTEILAKPRWIYRAVANLIDNAIKYGEGKPIHLSVQTKNRCVIVSVRDQGIGICAEKQENIFSERYRVNELNKDGYGIGLSLVSHVCDLCGGFVIVESELQRGTSFYMSFPQIS